jgi:hypothetical protein
MRKDEKVFVAVGCSKCIVSNSSLHSITKLLKNTPTENEEPYNKCLL